MFPKKIDELPLKVLTVVRKLSGIPILKHHRKQI